MSMRSGEMTTCCHLPARLFWCSRFEPFYFPYPSSYILKLMSTEPGTSGKEQGDTVQEGAQFSAEQLAFIDAC